MSQVFISYAKEDVEIARKLRNDLQRAGISSWMDVFDLLPGERWGVAIRHAIRASSFFIALLSSRSVGKRGYVQKEVREAIGFAEEFPQDEIFIIPVRIDACEPRHEDLRGLQRVDLFPSYCHGLRTLRQVLKSEVEQEVGNAVRKGTFTRLITDRGFGFIADGELNKDLFFLFRDVASLNASFIQEGMFVRYHLRPGPLGPVAVDITLA